MKRIKILGIFISALLFLWGCTDDTDPRYTIGTSVKPAAFTDPQDGKIYILAEGTGGNTFEKYMWESPDYGTSVGVQYSVQLDTANGDFSQPVTLITTSDRSARFSVMQMNNAILSFGISKAEPVHLKMRLVSNAMGGEEGAVMLNKFPTLYSEPITMTVTPYMGKQLHIPPYLFMVGNVLGSFVWDNNNYQYLFFKDNSESDNAVFIYTTNFKVGGFKMIEPPLGSWDNQYGMKDGKIVYQDGGSSDIKVDEAGYYTIALNTDKLEFSMTKYDASTAPTYASIGIIGDGAKGWGDNDDIMMAQTDYDPHVWIADDVVLDTKEVKFRVDHGWTTNWGVKGSFPYGIGVAGGDNIKVLEAGNYFVKFNDITGHFVFYKK